VAHHRRIAETHRAFVAEQSEVHRRFLAGRPLARGAQPSAPVMEIAPAPPSPRAVVRTPPPRKPAGPRLGRAELERLASGRISAVLGPQFAFQDDYRRQVRMPQPPLLLTDRVLAIEAEPLSMGVGSIQTETDVRWSSWFLHDGRMPPGLMIEAGQSDLLLISWLGVDRQNRGERVYRLLGSEITFHASPARPGETLFFDIEVERHARQGDVRLFFFRSECRVGSERRISVRNGQAGFFSDEELASSGGVLWDAETAVPREEAQDPPALATIRERFGPDEVRAFAEARVRDCFGEAYALAETHVRTPRIPAGDMQLFDEVTRLDPRGGPWGRGYMRAVRRISPDDWFFEGHFKDDPCMPGTLMFEGCYQAMAFYLAALGFTLPRDGWRFEPVPERPVHLRCRGQAIPGSRELAYEVFVEGVSAGPFPTLYAQVMCTIDGLKACHCAGIALQLVPDWPLASHPELLAGHTERRPVASVGGFRFDYASLLASAWGRPSESFGEVYADFDARRLPRLPGPPYHFLSRVARIDGPIGVVQAGTAIEAEYDVPRDAWYFAENGHATMPFAVFLEVGLQPCGWLAMSTGAPREWTEDLRFRNLDGTATWTREVDPDAGILTTRVRLKSISRSAGVVITSFDVEQVQDGEAVCRMETVFGFFPSAAFDDQPGLPTSDDERSWLERPSDFRVLLGSRPERYCAGSLRLPGPKLLMLDSVTGYWPDAGRAGLGRMRAEKRVDASEWFFKAHFFQDPVQPGSLGLEAMVQLLQFYMLERGLTDGMPSPRFMPLDLGRTLRWKYRGQVVPANKKVVVEIEVTESGRDDAGAYAVADAWLWVDGKRIYSASNLGMRAVPATASSERPSPFDVTGARAFWRKRLGTGPGLAEDLVDALARRFVGDVVVSDPPAFAALRGRPVLFLANHQVGIESLLCSVLVSGLQGRVLVALAKAEHRDSWMGRLIAHIARYPGAVDPRTLVFFDRSDMASLLPILEELRVRMTNEDASLLVHVEGTRALAARRPVSRMSGVWIDLALAADAPIVPVRFSGGLPLAEAAERLEFPVGFGRQTYHIGRPLPPHELRPLDLAARQRRVLDAINALGPLEEAASVPDPAFARAVEDWRRRTGAPAEHAVLLSSLAGLASPSHESRALLEGRRSDDERGRWLAEVARWLFGA
jgi:3-hydroxymyristoyl/3-hydroxydecanoyl-(acyl carrier protein) dehydratase/1-acyl-sn-glycerol-3-phosphate acyltransferase